MILHVPLYLMAKWGEEIAREELETQAQMKVALGLVISLLVYPVIFLILWLCLGFTMFGGLIAGAGVYIFNITHQAMVDENYDSFKRLIAAWRILVGVWAPNSGTTSMEGLRKLLPATSEPFGATPKGAMWAKGQSGPPPTAAKKVPAKHVPSRRLIRHVLRTRIEACRALESYLAELEREGGRIPARPWLAEAAAFGGEYPTPKEHHEDGEEQDWNPEGSRDGKELVAYLRQQGARILASQHEEHGEWASDGGGLTSGGEESDSGL